MPDTDTRAQHPYTVLVATDFSPFSDAAIGQGLRIAAEHRECDVHAVHVIDPSTGGPGRTARIRAQEVALEELPHRMHEYVTAQAQGIAGTDGARLGIHIRIGAPAEAILQVAVDVHADLLIVGTHGRGGVERAVLGSVAERLVRTAHCPVLVARPVRYDGLAESERADPPCDECVAERERTRGERWWCDLHGREHTELHVYSAVSPVHWSRGAAEIYGVGTPSTQW